VNLENEKTSAVTRTWFVALIGFAALIGCAVLANGFFHFPQFN
jgi:hypothetical protein